MTTHNKPMTFDGTHRGFVDDLGRVHLPQLWRDALAECEIGILMLSDGVEDHRLVVYPCPGGVPGGFRPEAHPSWGGLPPRGEHFCRVDPKGRFSPPARFRGSFPGPEVFGIGSQDHFVIRASAPDIVSPVATTEVSTSAGRSGVKS